MISTKTLESLKLNLILEDVSQYCVLESTKEDVLNTKPENSFNAVKNVLDLTKESYKLLFYKGSRKIEYFEDPLADIKFAVIDGVLTIPAILRVGNLLRSSASIIGSFSQVEQDEFPMLCDMCSCIYEDVYLLNLIDRTFINDETIADNATDRLYEIRMQIKTLTQSIKAKLDYYLAKSNALSDNIISIRDGRYVLPVRSDHKSEIKGFVHDTSNSGATFFIEPIDVLELNNKLREEYSREKDEINKILSDFSVRIKNISAKLITNVELLIKFDKFFAFAEYSYYNKCIYPELNNNGYIKIVSGRHPFIDKKKVVPISVTLGDTYHYLLISGPNTGGKTVTLKLIGLFCLMTYCGLFIPCFDDTCISFFDNIFTDIGDDQSIENNLSTFSSHLKNLIDISNEATSRSLVLLDELGGGTDPEEGSALACGIVEYLLKVDSFGVITTHYSLLKEYALSNPKIMNASMDFDQNTNTPMYKVSIGYPGQSRALEISKKLGLNNEILNNAYLYLSDNKIKFNKILEKADEIRLDAERIKNDYSSKLIEINNRLVEISKQEEKINAEKERINKNANALTKNIIHEKTAQAEELLAKMKEIFKKAELSSKDLIDMSSLKNKMYNQDVDFDDEVISSDSVDKNDVKIGDTVFVKTLSKNGTIKSINKDKYLVDCGNITINCNIKDLSLKVKKENVKVVVNSPRRDFKEPITSEINVIGFNTDDALLAVDNFIDKSITNHLEVIRIVHGKGMRILSKAISQFLKNDDRVKEFRFGKYGEGEDGVTIVTL